MDAQVSKLLTVAESAFVASVPVRDINRVIDEHIVPSSFLSPETGWLIMAGGCPLTSFDFAGAKRLTADERLLAIGRVGEMLATGTARPGRLAKEDWTVRDGFLTIDLEPFRIAADERMAKLEAARAVGTMRRYQLP